MRRKPLAGEKGLAYFLTNLGVNEKEVPKDELYYAYLEMIRLGLAGLVRIERNNQERLRVCNKELIDLDHILEVEKLTREEKGRLIDEREEVRDKRRIVQSIKEMSGALKDRQVDIGVLSEKLEDVIGVCYKKVTPSEKVYTFKSERGAVMYENITGKRTENGTIATANIAVELTKEKTKKGRSTPTIRTLAEAEGCEPKPLSEIEDLSGYLEGIKKGKKGGY
ncbi:hypothetical protein [Bacillus cereus]|uniref:hypothetical protein n=1 Tax=Bacillus cereus TaxID=1396 RepID=UPI000BFB9CD5|nr:hypothetical protein [Bacillus cereus]PGR83743.1 hypothetical protein COC63_07065 [Bacillus cereus]